MRRTKSTGIIRAQILPQEARGRAEKDRLSERERERGCFWVIS